jgi:hypothetical protein
MEVGGRKLVQGWTVIAVTAAAALLLASCGGGSSSAALCRPNIAPHLTPPGGGRNAFTMGIRVNRAADVDEIESAIGDRILPRDIFVINTEFPHSKPSDWEASLERVSEKFRCNRIVTLTGLSPDPTRPGYEYALVDRPELDAVLVDWEPDTWETARQGHWTTDQAANENRIASELGALSHRLADSSVRMGLVPDYVPRWDYGPFGRVVAEQNYSLDPIHRGYQIVQTQPNCGDPNAAGPLIPGVTHQLISQYRGIVGLSLRVHGPKGEPPDVTSDLLNHLGFEVAFDESPNPKASEPVERIGPEQAAGCTQQILREGGAGVLYWASPDSIKAMLESRAGLTLRPAHGSSGSS